MRKTALIVLFCASFAGAPAAFADARADYEAAVAALRAGKQKEAIAFLTRAIVSKEVSGDALAALYALRAEVHVQSGQPLDAVVDFTKAIELLPNDSGAERFALLYYNRAEANSRSAKLDAAIADYTKTIELVPDHAAAFGDRAVAYAQLKKFKEALDDLSRAQFLAPNSPIPYFNRGRIYEGMGRKNEAIAEYRKARAADPKMKEPQEALKRLGAR